MAHNLTKLSDWECDESVDAEINAALTRVTEFFWEAAEADDDDEMDYPESPSGYLYDGCETCQGREYAAVLFPVIAQATIDGRIWRSSVAEDVATALLESEIDARTHVDDSDGSDPDRTTAGPTSGGGDS